MPNQSLQSCFAGSMIGTFVGDALGRPFEGTPTDLIEEFWPQVTNKTGMPRRYTDDTQMMIGISESLVARRGVDPAHMAQCFADNFDHRRGYGHGASTAGFMILIALFGLKLRNRSGE